MQQLFAQLEALQPFPEELQSLLKAIIHTEHLAKDDAFFADVHGTWVFIEKGFLERKPPVKCLLQR